MRRWWSASLSPRRVFTGETSATLDPRRCVRPCAMGCSGDSSVRAGFTATSPCGFYSFSQCLWFRIEYSDSSVWVMYLWPSDPSRVCFCHSPIDSLHTFQGSTSPQLSITSRLQKLVGWINKRAASDHIQPGLYCLLAGFVNLKPLT